MDEPSDPPRALRSRSGGAPLAPLAEPEFDRILAKLGLKSFERRIRIFLYDDVTELQRITGVSADGDSIPLESHVPRENDQTRLHEMVHAVAEKFEEQGSQTRNLFWIGGKLAVEGPVEGTAGLIGLGSVGGSARFTAVASRALE